MRCGRYEREIAAMSPQRICPNGHVFTKTSDCPTCPQCAKERAPKNRWLARLSGPTRGALEHEGVANLKKLAKWSEKEVLALHGVGPASLPALRGALEEVGLAFRSNAGKQPASKGDTMNTDKYLATLPPDQRKALERLRKQILAAVPGTEQGFGYGVPAFKYNGHPLVYMGASKNHCGLYGSVPPGFKEALKGYKLGKGSIQFTPEKPIPADVLKALLRAKAAEIEVRWPVKDKGIR